MATSKETLKSCVKIWRQRKANGEKLSSADEIRLNIYQDVIKNLDAFDILKDALIIKVDNNVLSITTELKNQQIDIHLSKEEYDILKEVFK